MVKHARLRTVDNKETHVLVGQVRAASININNMYSCVPMRWGRKITLNTGDH